MATFALIGAFDLQAEPANSQRNKVRSLNQRDFQIENSIVGILGVDLASDTGTITLASRHAEYGMMEFTGAKTGAVTIQVPIEFEMPYWVGDFTTDSAAVTFEPTGGTGVVLPKNQWIRVYHDGTNSFLHQIGYQDPANAALITLGTDWIETSGRGVQLWKQNADDAVAGGFLHIEGAMEKTTAPANGDTILTLPANYRPAFVQGFSVITDPETNGSAALAFVEVSTGGAVILRNGAPAQDITIDLSSIKFQVGG